MNSKHYLGDLCLIDGNVYVDREIPSYAYRYIGEINDSSNLGYAFHVFRCCRSGKLISMPYTKAEERFWQQPSRESDNG